MKTHLKRISVPGLLVTMLALLLGSCSQQSNWPQFRGPDANMIVKGENLPTEWGEDLNVAWTCEVEGDGWASPIVWGNQVFVATVVPVKINKPGEGEGGAENQDLFRQDVYRWELSSVDLETGKEIWKKVAYEGSPRTGKHARTNYASETPVTDGQRVYVYYGMIGLFCYDMEGELLWEKDLGAYETLNSWGTGSSPVLYKGKLFVKVDNEENSFLVALDASTGEEIWRMDRDEKTNYSTPFIWENRVRTELVTGGQKARAYDPESGELLWELQVDGFYNIPMPVADRDMIFMGNEAYRDEPGTFYAIEAGAEGDITPDPENATSSAVVWYDRDASYLGHPTPLLHEGLIYLVNTRGGEITCLEAESGDLVYREKMDDVAAVWASPWMNGEVIYFLDEKGVTWSFKAGREFEALGKSSLDDHFWASVAVAGDAYLFKGDNKLYFIRN